MLDPALIDTLFPPDLPEVGHWRDVYPPRDLPAAARVTRFSPSPTGLLHLGGLYTAMIDKDVAVNSGGVYFLRIEDTDQARQMPGAVEQFDRALAYLSLQPTEADPTGRYGPYTQSERSRIYLSYARQLLRTGRAYLCFATREDLTDITTRQQRAKVPTGYYDRWALWRDAPAARVEDALAAGRPYVIRFRSTGDGGRAAFADAIRGRVEMDDNRNDAVIIKTSDAALRLPTYHFAHAVDDHLMGVNLVVRGEEWLASVPLHLQLFDALGFDAPTYAHIAPLLKQDGTSKRKLSKRKDPEASTDYYLQAGYPAAALLYYLRGLANGRLADLPAEQSLAQPLRLDQFGVSGALLDLVKLDDIAADHIAAMPAEDILDQVGAWAHTHDPQLAAALADHRKVAVAALGIERAGVRNPRKDLRRWSQFREIYGYFLPPLFDPVNSLADTPLADLDTSIVAAFAGDLADSYRPLPEQQAWFDQIRAAAARHGFAATPQQYGTDPGAYPGSIREAAQIIRVALTGSTRSPDLHAVATVLGADEVVARIRTLTGHTTPRPQ